MLPRMPSDDASKGLRVGPKEPSPETHIRHDEVLIVLTQAYCPSGHNLIRPGEKFDGFDGLHLWISGGKVEGLVVVSPIHGDHRKRGISFPDGTQLEIACPECRKPLPRLCPCSCGHGGSLRTIYLTPGLSESYQAAVCDIWGCPRSRVIDSNEILSEFIEAENG